MPESLPSSIAIDGPAASGKSSLGKKIADDLGYLFFDTGVMYRAVTWSALEHQIPIENEVEITSLAKKIIIDVLPPSQKDGRNCDILVDGTDITWQIREPQVDANVSAVSAYPGVREALTAQQRRIGKRGRVVMIGRDIGTVVLPEAELKVYLDASAGERARRRYLEKQNRGESADLDEIMAGVKMRDQIDSSRSVAPLKPADDAIRIDSDHLTLDEVFDHVMKLITHRA
jgi:CMP/dCMP kinase